jgi:DNA-binding CsgD family transcriptional regulator
MFSEFVAPGDLGHAQEIFARILCNGEPAEFTVQIRDPAGGFSPVEISSAPLRGNGSVVGVFGLGRERAPTSRPNENGETSVCATTNLLTPRQLEVVRLLAAGLSTRDIAAALHLSSTTVRNHVAMILATLGVHTRLQAVMAAQARGLLDG